MVADGGGLRKDEGKPRTDLIPTDAMLELSKLYEMGSKKYADRNWERGMLWSKVYGPLTRHLFKWWMGEDRDSESGLSHMTHVAWNAIALMTYEMRKIGTDDRSKIWQNQNLKKDAGYVPMNSQPQTQEKSSPIPMRLDTWENMNIPLR